MEHARIWYFNSDGKEEVFLSSADWMKRNLSRRIETAFPITNEQIKQKVIKILRLQLQDNIGLDYGTGGGKACIIDENLQNIPVVENSEKPVRAQQEIYELLKNEAESTTHI